MRLSGSSARTSWRSSSPSAAWGRRFVVRACERVRRDPQQSVGYSESATPAATTEAPSPATLVAPNNGSDFQRDDGCAYALGRAAIIRATSRMVGTASAQHRYSDLSMVMDSGGAIHAAAVINGGSRVLRRCDGHVAPDPLSAPLEEDEKWLAARG